MTILDRLRGKRKQIADPFGIYHRTISYVLMLESWDSYSEQYKRDIIEWSKQNLWADELAYRVLAALRNEEIKV